jgi:uncharacterized protein (DUF433 family)
MPVCTKCFIDKPIDQYAIDKQPNKVYRKRYCLDCFRKQAREWKAKNRITKKIMDDPNYKQCSSCMIYKLLDEFYLSHSKKPVKMCKPCYKEYHANKVQEKFRENGGKDQYYKEPNRYTTQEQKDQVFMVMKACGWIFDEDKGIWNKPKIKEDGVFINFEPSNKPKRKSPTPGGGRKVKKGVWNSVDKIIELLGQGYTYNDVADTFECSHTLIRLVVSTYRNEKRPC